MRFLILLGSGQHRHLEGEDIIDACVKQRIDPVACEVYAYAKESDIAGNANCGCTYHAEESMACQHDIRYFWRYGIQSLNPEGRWPQLTKAEVDAIVKNSRRQ